jgi:hypothetical protein
VLLGCHGRCGCEYLQPSKPCLATATTTTTRISSSFSPARTAAQRLEALRGGRQITLSSTIHIIARSSSWLPGRIASGTAATVYRPHSQHASKSRDGQAIPQDSIVSLMTPCSQIPEDTESIPEAEGDSAVMPDLGSERLRHLKRLANDHGHGASRPSSLRLGLCVRVV